MQAINPYTQIYNDFESEEKVLRKIEAVARTCYKSEGKIQEGSARKMVKALIKSGHESMLECVSITVKFVCDRGISHEIVRHRLASYAQESQRYCNYSKDDFGSEITFIIPEYLKFGSKGWKIWKDAMKNAEDAYFQLLDFGLTPQEARAVLPNSTKTELCMTANLREWRYFFKLRYLGTTGRPHPQMIQITEPLLWDFYQLLPTIFEDLVPDELKAKYVLDEKGGESDEQTTEKASTKTEV